MRIQLPVRMTKAEYLRKLNEVDRLLNDPTISMDPAKIWSLLADIAEYTGAWTDAFDETDSQTSSSEDSRTHVSSTTVVISAEGEHDGRRPGERVATATMQ